MEQYSVKAVTRLTGLTPETLRAWERRYAAVAPARDGAGRRIYTPDDVEALRLYKQLVDAGHPISRVVGMDDSERRRLAQASARTSAGGDLDAVREQLLEAVRDYDAPELERRLGRVMATVDADTLVDEVLGPVLRAVGASWEKGEMDIAQERLMSSVVRDRIIASLRSAPDLQPALMLATPSGERHELGLLMFAYRAASRLVPLRYLGPDLPLAEVRRLAERFGAGTVALSLVNPPGGDLLEEIRSLTDDGLTVWLGGHGAQALGDDVPSGCHVLESADAIRRALDDLTPAR